MEESRLEIKLDRIVEDQSEIKITLARLTSSVEQNTKDVAEHIARTEILEGRVDILEEPRRVRKYLIKVLLVLGSIAGAILAICKLFEIF